MTVSAPPVSSAPTRFYTVPPCRVLDTRNPVGTRGRSRARRERLEGLSRRRGMRGSVHGDCRVGERDGHQSFGSGPGADLSGQHRAAVDVGAQLPGGPDSFQRRHGGARDGRHRKDRREERRGGNRSSRPRRQRVLPVGLAPGDKNSGVSGPRFRVLLAGLFLLLVAEARAAEFLRVSGRHARGPRNRRASLEPRARSRASSGGAARRHDLAARGNLSREIRERARGDARGADRRALVPGRVGAHRRRSRARDCREGDPLDRGLLLVVLGLRDHVVGPEAAVVGGRIVSVRHRPRGLRRDHERSRREADQPGLPRRGRRVRALAGIVEPRGVRQHRLQQRLARGDGPRARTRDLRAERERLEVHHGQHRPAELRHQRPDLRQQRGAAEQLRRGRQHRLPGGEGHDRRPGDGDHLRGSRRSRRTRSSRTTPSTRNAGAA